MQSSIHHFKILENELFWILGHNGAGKSTLINMLIGILPPTKNSASIFGFDIIDEIDEARKFIGVIPQFDILWNDLTVYQNMEIICYLKNVEPQQTIKDTLEAVQLFEWDNIEVSKLSGGMRRRVSFAMSMIGNPRIIFMDEPTSGMDPIIRRQVWNIIRDIKKTTTIILTTHSMEEADVLSDRIGVMVDGEFLAIDTSLGLKNQYGKGYKITMLTNKNNMDYVIDLSKILIPQLKVVHKKGGSIIMTLSYNDFSKLMDSSNLKLFFELMKNDKSHADFQDKNLKELRDLIYNCGISQTSLEEVFISINSKGFE